ncbi:MAG: hypothetical protein WC564_05390 [Patescibacteria group bacterium]
MKKIGLACIALFLIIVANDIFTPTGTFIALMIGLGIGILGFCIIVSSIASKIWTAR